MKTIRVKIFMIFAAFMVSLVLSGILLNALFLQRYYIYKSRDVFVDADKKIAEEYVNNRKNIINLITYMDRVEGISCIITDKSEVVKYSSSPQKQDPDAARLPGEVEQLIYKNKGKLSKNFIYSVVEKVDDQAPKLVFISRMENGDLIILRKPLKGISESVAIANQFYIFAGLVLIVLGGIFILIFSKKITKPVIEMSNVAEGISNLDFNKRVIYEAEDELGSLGKSINNISEKLSTSMNGLKQDVERRKQLVRNISHELKTPIGVIKGYAEGLKYGVAEDKEKANKYCTVIAEECNRMDGMVRELLELSMLESGMFKLNISKFEVGELLMKINTRLEAVIAEKYIKLNLNCEENLMVEADYELLERAVNNYIINAINHVDEMKLIKVCAERKGTGIRISVFNTGRPIPEEDIKNIWDVFYKVDKARTRQYGGHGLGLSIVRQITELHGGTAGVINASDGVLFYIDIP